MVPFPFNPRCYAATPIRGTAALRAGRLRRLLQALRNALPFLWFYHILLKTFANKLNSKLFFYGSIFPFTPRCYAAPPVGHRGTPCRPPSAATPSSPKCPTFSLVLLHLPGNVCRQMKFQTLFLRFHISFYPPPLTRRAAHACSCLIPRKKHAVFFLNKFMEIYSTCGLFNLCNLHLISGLQILKNLRFGITNPKQRLLVTM